MKSQKKRLQTVKPIAVHGYSCSSFSLLRLVHFNIIPSTQITIIQIVQESTNTIGSQIFSVKINRITETKAQMTKKILFL